METVGRDLTVTDENRVLLRFLLIVNGIYIIVYSNIIKNHVGAKNQFVKGLTQTDILKIYCKIIF